VALHREAALEAETEPFPMEDPRTVAEAMVDMAAEAVEDKDGGNSSFQSAMLPFVAGHSTFFFFFALSIYSLNTQKHQITQKWTVFPSHAPLFLDIFFSNVESRHYQLT